MNYLIINFYKLLRKIYRRLGFTVSSELFISEQNSDAAADIVYQALISEKPCMIGRFGSTELNCLSNYIGINRQGRQPINYIKGLAEPWWVEEKNLIQMQQWAGFFPPKIEYIENFCKLMISDIPEVDVLGSWLPQEKLFADLLANSQKINFELLSPYFSKIPWTRALKGKKVLVVHPLENTIIKQYKKRELLFGNDLLPEFELMTLKSVQSIAGNPTEFDNWFEALEYMKLEINKYDYDICLIGCGSYGFPLAAHVKRMGKKGFNLGGALQLLFGIRGKRWESEDYNPVYNYAKLMNKHWVKPSKEETPKGACIVEGGCYW